MTWELFFDVCGVPLTILFWVVVWWALGWLKKGARGNHDR